MTVSVALPDAGEVRVDSAVLTTMWAFAQCGRHDTEAGGVLIGHYPATSMDVVLDRLTTPLPGDQRTRTRFYRSQAPHQAEIDREWAVSGGRRVYLGEWHTHPERVPHPSHIDFNGWRDKLFAKLPYPRLLFVIVGTERTRMWHGCCGSPFTRLVLDIATEVPHAQSQQR